MFVSSGLFQLVQPPTHGRSAGFGQASFAPPSGEQRSSQVGALHEATLQALLPEQSS
jgi:hypothetical protein